LELQQGISLSASTCIHLFLNKLPTQWGLSNHSCAFTRTDRKLEVNYREILLNVLLILQYGGVIGAFNCQGAGWDPKEKRIKGYSECYKPISCSVHVCEIEWNQKIEAAHLGEAEEYVVHLNEADELRLMTPKSDAIHVIIQPSGLPHQVRATWTYEHVQQWRHPPRVGVQK
jgi:hypothetical protein